MTTATIANVQDIPAEELAKLTIKLSPSLAVEAIQGCFAQQQPVFLWGTHGIAKSATARFASEDMGFFYCDLRATLLDPVDLRGIPYIEDRRTHSAPPVFFPTARDPRTAICIDELTRAPAMVQNALYQLVLDRACGEYRLPDDTVMLACGNYTGKGVVKMDPALATRYVHIHMTVDFDDWMAWAAMNGLHLDVILYLREHPDMLFNESDDLLRPRTWEFVSRVISRGMSDRVEFALLQGTVGVGAAISFHEWREARRLPSIDSILMDPTGIEVPSHPAERWTIASGLSYRACAENMDRVVTYLDRMPTEFALFALKTATRREQRNATPEKDRITSSAAYVRYQIAHQQELK